MRAKSPGPFRRAEENYLHSRQTLADEERLLDIGEQETDGVVAAFHDRTAAEHPGVDTAALRQVDQEFDDQAFRAIARETFLKVTEARKLQNPAESADLLSPQMQGELQDAISGDFAAHRRHLLALLTIQDAVITGAQVVGGQEQADVVFTISAIEEDVDDRTGQVLAGGPDPRSWQERWRFTRNPAVDTSASDVRHEISFDRATQWLVAHRGWIVTHIERLPAS